MRTWWVEGVVPGGVAVVERPRGGDWLAHELRDLANQGITHMVSAQPLQEAATHGLSDEGEACTAAGLAFLRLPIEDMTAPAPGAFSEELRFLAAALAQGAKIGVHCRAGLGRSPMLVAAILVQRDTQVEEAWVRIAAARGLPVPETEAQRAWLAHFAASVRRLA